MRRVIDEFRQLPIEDIAELLVYPVKIEIIDYDGEDHILPSCNETVWTSNLFDTEYADSDDAVNAVIAYLEQSI